ncbi:MAG: lipopolysaccharide kinase InaA family protein, partial [Candidatus Cloacimonadota bacterium]|nr:lipopolysaccharide kinase InaA family protein [Candidatus Cloacimonadota bacterium]
KPEGKSSPVYFNFMEYTKRDKHQRVKLYKTSGLLHPELAKFFDNKSYKTLFETNFKINIHKLKRNKIINIKLLEDLKISIPHITLKISQQGLYRQLESIFKRSKANRAYISACKFLDSGLSTPRPLGYLESKWGPFTLNSIYISETIPNAKKLKDYFKDPSVSDIKKRKTAIKVANFCRKMHNIGIKHHDLHLSNFIFDASQPEIEPTIIDLNRCKFRSKLSLCSRLQDLSRMHLDEYNDLFIEHYSLDDLNIKKYWWIRTLYLQLRRIRKKLSHKLKNLFNPR